MKTCKISPNHTSKEFIANIKGCFGQDHAAVGALVKKFLGFVTLLANQNVLSAPFVELLKGDKFRVENKAYVLKHQTTAGDISCAFQYLESIQCKPSQNMPDCIIDSVSFNF